MSDNFDNNIEHIAPRVYRLEWRADYHEEQLTELHRDNKAQQVMLESINKRLSAIFWAIVGYVSFGLAHEFGLLTILKELL